jgi:hypothetical protein
MGQFASSRQKAKVGALPAWPTFAPLWRTVQRQQSGRGEPESLAIRGTLMVTAKVQKPASQISLQSELLRLEQPHAPAKEFQSTSGTCPANADYNGLAKRGLLQVTA